MISDKRMECIAKGITLAGREVSSFLNQAIEALKEEAWEQIRPIEEELKATGFDVRVRVETGLPQTRILEIAESEAVSAVVIGSHGRSNVSTVLLGSVSDHVIRHAKQPVLVIKRD